MALDVKQKRKLAVPFVLAAGSLASVSGTVLLSRVVSDDARHALRDFDDDIGDRIRDGDSLWSDRVMRLLSGLGEPFTTYPVSGLAAIWFLTKRNPPDSITVLVATGGSAAVDTAVKQMVKRRRPLRIFRQQKTSGWSFPSKHSTMSLATYGSIGYLIVRRNKMRPKEAATRVWLPVAGLCGAIGYSRIALDVHYPSDVLGGWIVSSIWLAACIVARELMNGDAQATGQDRGDEDESALPEAQAPVIIWDNQI